MCEDQQIWVFCREKDCNFEGVDFSEEEIKHIEENFCPYCNEATLVVKKVAGGAMI